MSTAAIMGGLREWKPALALGMLAALATAGVFTGAWYLLPFFTLAIGALLIIGAASVRFPYWLLSVFVLVVWFPEFSQTEDVYTAQDAPSIYNFRPLPGITASVFDYLFAAIVFVWILKYVLPNPRRVLRAPLAGNMLALFAIWILNFLHGIFRGNETYYALREFRVGAYFVLTYLMVVTSCGEMREVRKFIKLSVGMAAFIGVYGILRYVLGVGKEFADARLIYYDIADSVVLYIAMLLIASFAIEGTLTKGKGLLTTVLTFPMVFSFLFSYRRGAWVALSAGLVFLIVFYPHRADFRRLAFRRVLVPAALIIGLIAAVPALRSNGLDFVAARINSIFDVSEDSSNVFRVVDAMNALKSFTQHPIIGVGAGGRYDLEFTSDRVLTSFMEEVNRTSHNGYLYVLFKTGVIGFLTYLAVFVKFLRQWFKARNLNVGPRERGVLMAVGAIVIAMLVNNLTETVSDLLRPSMLLAFVMGWGAIFMRDLASCSEIGSLSTNGLTEIEAQK